MPHDRDTAYRLYSVDGDFVPTLARRIGQTVPNEPFKNLPKSLRPEAEKWRPRQILLRPEAEKQQFRQDWLGTVQTVPVHFEGKNVAVHFSKLPRPAQDVPVHFEGNNVTVHFVGI